MTDTFIGRESVDEVVRKIKILKRPKHFSIRPVLICAGRVDKDVIASQFFNRIITAENLFE